MWLLLRAAAIKMGRPLLFAMLFVVFFSRSHNTIIYGEYRSLLDSQRFCLQLSEYIATTKQPTSFIHAVTDKTQLMDKLLSTFCDSIVRFLASK